MGPRITSQDAMDVDQSLPTSGVSTTGFAIGVTGDENQPTGEPPDTHEGTNIHSVLSFSLIS